MMTKSPKNNFRRFWTILVTLVTLDQISKYITRAGGHMFPITILDNWIYIRPSFNTGAAWGIFSRNAHALGLLGCLALAAIFLYRKKLEIITYQCTFGSICGGIVGNIIDRLIFGCVTDFIDINLQVYRWPTFNIADSAICLGVTYYILGTSLIRPANHRQ
ncbi:MAG: signal peptidase II [Puniceicoccales bacterium]|jgi:signal peptidase II|nr:signal peptidase II [Puniceicoccales bacterium]